MAIRAILRVAKLKGAGKATASGEHLERTRDTPNADPSRRHLNKRLAGSGDLWADIKARLDDLPGKPRRTAVHAIELLLSASPAYFAGADRATLDAWTRAIGEWTHARFGAKNVVAAMLHLDEETPHLHVVIVPVVVKTLKGKDAPEERLCARDITGGRYRLSKLQDEYAAAVAHLGIERGVKGARIEYDHLHRRYAEMTGTPPAAEKIVEAIAVRPPSPGTPQQMRAYAAAEQARIRRAVLPMIEAQAARCEELERRGRDEEKRTAALQGELREARALAAAAVAVDLGTILRLLGGTRGPHDPHLWRVGGRIVAVDGQRYRDLTGRADGLGAVALLAQLTGCAPGRALAFLAQRAGPEACAAAAAQHAAMEATGRAAAIAERAIASPAVELAPLRVPGPAPVRADPAKDAGQQRPPREITQKREGYSGHGH